MTPIRRLDHVAVLVRSTEEALGFYEGQLGLRVHSSEEIDVPRVRLTYLDVGNTFLQLVEPLDPGSPLAEWLTDHGEGLHHICFGVDDVSETIVMLSDNGTPGVLGSGRGRVSGFVSAAASRGVRIECTQFVREQDVEAMTGWLPPAR